MLAYKVKTGRVVAVECEKMEYPLRDNDGDIIYINTHFATKKEALEKAIRECNAWVKMNTDRVKQIRTEELKLQKETMDALILLRELEEEMFKEG